MGMLLDTSKKILIIYKMRSKSKWKKGYRQRDGKFLRADEKVPSSQCVVRVTSLFAIQFVWNVHLLCLCLSCVSDLFSLACSVLFLGTSFSSTFFHQNENRLTRLKCSGAHSNYVHERTDVTFLVKLPYDSIPLNSFRSTGLSVLKIVCFVCGAPLGELHLPWLVKNRSWAEIQRVETKNSTFFILLKQSEMATVDLV